MRYVARGEVPAKRHSQFRENGRLLVEEVMGYEGFSGNESILYHRHSPCRIQQVGAFRSLARWREHDDPEYAYSWNPDREHGVPRERPAPRDGAVGAAR